MVNAGSRTLALGTLGAQAGLGLLVEHFSCKEEVVGSSPTLGSRESPLAAMLGWSSGAAISVMVGPRRR